MYTKQSIIHRFLLLLGECLVNSKIPLNLFAKLESRLRRYLQTKLPLPIANTSSSSNIVSTADQSDILAGDEVLAATIESLHITQDQNGNDDGGDDQQQQQADPHDSLEQDTKRNIKVYLYQYPDTEQGDSSASRSLDTTPSDSTTSESFYTLETFPSASLRGLWETLEFDSSVKSSILAYITAIFKFSLLGLTGRNEISFNRILLLHGPPGTGKTTLAKALVFKLSTRLYSLQSSRSDNPPTYTRLQCITVHSAQLFSRWFSESSKSVQKLFEFVAKLAKQPGNFVCVLIDEIESLAMSRKQSADHGSSEPTDSIRAVNTLLTQIDQLRSLPNILYLTTSNFPSLVDSAFLDRVDWSFEVSLPSDRVIYSLLVACVRAMRAQGLIKGPDELANSAQAAQLIGGPSQDLLSLSKSLLGQSGRAVKRLPLMAYAAFLQKNPNASQFTLSQFISFLKDLLQNE